MPVTKITVFIITVDEVWDQHVYSDGQQSVVWAIGPLNDRKEVSYHRINSAGDVFVDFARTPKWNCPTPDSDTPLAQTTTTTTSTTTTAAPITRSRTRSTTPLPPIVVVNQPRNQPVSRIFSPPAVPVPSRAHHNHDHPTHRPTSTRTSSRGSNRAASRSSSSPSSSAHLDDGTVGSATSKTDGAWEIPPIICPADRTFRAQIGPTGGKKGYQSITGRVGWGIAWYINGLLVPELVVQRGKTYTFIVEGGNDPVHSARRHPLYITDNPEGGYDYRTDEERAQQKIFAGAALRSDGQIIPTSEGRLCEWKRDTRGSSSADDYKDFFSYQRTLNLQCQAGKGAIMRWTPDSSTPDVVYYQCWTHRLLGWKIRVVDSCDNLASSSNVRIAHASSSALAASTMSPYTVTLTTVTSGYTFGRSNKSSPSLNSHINKPSVGSLSSSQNKPIKLTASGGSANQAFNPPVSGSFNSQTLPPNANQPIIHKKKRNSHKRAQQNQQPQSTNNPILNSYRNNIENSLNFDSTRINANNHGPQNGNLNNNRQSSSGNGPPLRSPLVNRPVQYQFQPHLDAWMFQPPSWTYETHIPADQNPGMAMTLEPFFVPSYPLPPIDPDRPPVYIRQKLPAPIPLPKESHSSLSRNLHGGFLPMLINSKPKPPVPLNERMNQLKYNISRYGFPFADHNKKVMKEQEMIKIKNLPPQAYTSPSGVHRYPSSSSSSSSSSHSSTGVSNTHINHVSYKIDHTPGPSTGVSPPTVSSKLTDDNKPIISLTSGGPKASSSFSSHQDDPMMPMIERDSRTSSSVLRPKHSSLSQNDHDHHQRTPNKRKSSLTTTTSQAAVSSSYATSTTAKMTQEDEKSSTLYYSGISAKNDLSLPTTVQFARGSRPSSASYTTSTSPAPSNLYRNTYDPTTASPKFTSENVITSVGSSVRVINGENQSTGSNNDPTSLSSSSSASPSHETSSSPFLFPSSISSLHYSSPKPIERNSYVEFTSNHDLESVTFGTPTTAALDYISEKSNKLIDSTSTSVEPYRRDDLTSTHNQEAITTTTQEGSTTPSSFPVTETEAPTTKRLTTRHDFLRINNVLNHKNKSSSSSVYTDTTPKYLSTTFYNTDTTALDGSSSSSSSNRNHHHNRHHNRHSADSANSLTSSNFNPSSFLALNMIDNRTDHTILNHILSLIAVGETPPEVKVFTKKPPQTGSLFSTHIEVHRDMKNNNNPFSRSKRSSPPLISNFESLEGHHPNDGHDHSSHTFPLTSNEIQSRLKSTSNNVSNPSSDHHLLNLLMSVFSLIIVCYVL